MMQANKYNYLSEWVNKEAFIDYIESSSFPLTIDVASNCTNGVQNKKLSFLNSIKKYKLEKLEKNRINPNDILNSTVSPIRQGDSSLSSYMDDGLDHIMPINEIGGKRHFLKKFSKVLQKKCCKWEDQAEIWLIASGAADLLHRPVFEVYYEELCSDYDRNFARHSQNISASPTTANYQNIISNLDSHRCATISNQPSRFNHCCCFQKKTIKYHGKCHNPFCGRRNLLLKNVTSYNNNSILAKTHKDSYDNISENNFVCCLRGYATIKKLITVLKTLHPELTELSLLEVVSWITIHFFKREIELFAFLLSLLRSKHYDYFDQTISQNIISSLTLRHLLQDYVKRNYSNSQLTNHSQFILHRRLSKIKLPQDEYRYVNNKSRLNLDNKEFLISKWKVFLLTNLSLDLQIRVIDCFVIDGPGVLFKTFVYCFSRIHDYIVKNNIDLSNTSPFLINEICEELILQIICSGFSENVIEQIMKLPIKTNRINALYRIYFSFFSKGCIDSQVINLLSHSKWTSLSRNSSRITNTSPPVSKAHMFLSNSTSQHNTTQPTTITTSSGQNHNYTTEGSFNISSEDSSEMNENYLYSPTTLLKYNEWKHLLKWIPQRLHLFKAICIFSTSKHGYNLKTLYHHCENSSPIIVIIHTKNNELFGAYISTKLTNRFLARRGFFGTGEIFVFQLRPILKKYIWIGIIKNQMKSSVTAHESSHKRSKSYTSSHKCADKVAALSSSNLELATHDKSLSNYKNNSQYANQQYRPNIISRIKKRFKSAFGFKNSSIRLPKACTIADPSPALISLEIEKTETKIIENDQTPRLSTNMGQLSNLTKSIYEQKIILDDLFVSCDNQSFIVGGGREGFAIQLDASLLNGNSRTCDTFNNPSFVSGEDGDFVCTRVDVIGFVDSYPNTVP